MRQSTRQKIVDRLWIAAFALSGLVCAVGIGVFVYYEFSGTAFDGDYGVAILITVWAMAILLGAYDPLSRGGRGENR